MATIRNNAAFIHHDKIASAVIVNDSLKVTHGQPHNDARLVVDGDMIAVHVQSGRKKSAEIARLFNWASTKTVATKGGGGGSPKELNFFLTIAIDFKDGSKTKINLGQGSYGIRNNWWIGFTDRIFNVEPSSLSHDFGGVFDAIPVKYRAIATEIGENLLGELFGAVNVFRLS